MMYTLSPMTGQCCCMSQHTTEFYNNPIAKHPLYHKWLITMHHSTEPGSLFSPLTCTKIWYHSTNIGGSESSSPDKLRMQEDLCFLSWKSQQVWGEFVYKTSMFYFSLLLYLSHNFEIFQKKKQFHQTLRGRPNG